MEVTIRAAHHHSATELAFYREYFARSDVRGLESAIRYRQRRSGRPWHTHSRRYACSLRKRYTLQGTGDHRKIDEADIQDFPGARRDRFFAL